uniref:Uncharacterized protein n=1 Tax=Leersia perrieri TaxID=77586 RepID=A0A0D9X5L7_9ORYZ
MLVVATTYSGSILSSVSGAGEKNIILDNEEKKSGGVTPMVCPTVNILALYLLFFLRMD